MLTIYHQNILHIIILCYFFYFFITAISFCNDSSFPFNAFLSTTFMAYCSLVFLSIALYTSEKAPLWDKNKKKKKKKKQEKQMGVIN